MDAKISKNVLFSVEYPCIVKNENAMLETMGGINEVYNVYKDPVKKLELKLRPDDAFSRVVCADRIASHKLLLKVSRKKPPEVDRADQVEGGGRQTDTDCAVDDQEMTAEIVGIAETAYKFESMVDFQYMAAKRKANGEYESFYDDVVPPNHVLPLPGWLSRDVPLFLPAPLYSRMDRPQEYSYKDRPKERLQKRLHIKNQPDSAIVIDRSCRKMFSQFHNFSMVGVPPDPAQEALDRLRKRPSYGADIVKIEELKKAFEIRPLWTRIALECTADVSRDQLKFILPLVAYYWETGPWRTMWCRYGYDPRTDPSAKIYQLVDFRVRGARFHRINVKRSNTKNFLLPNKVHRTGANPQGATLQHSHLCESQQTGGRTTKDESKETLWRFRKDVLPSQRQTFYQMCDIEVAEVQEIVHLSDGQEKECSEKFGWLVPNYADKVRVILTKVVEEQLEKLDPLYKQRVEGNAHLIEAKWKRPKETGKSGPKHKAKSSSTHTAGEQKPASKSTGSSANSSQNIDKMSRQKLVDEISRENFPDDQSSDDNRGIGDSSDNSEDEDGIDLCDLTTSRILRTKTAIEEMEQLGMDLDDMEEDDTMMEDEGMADDSDEDPTYDVVKAFQGKG